MFGHVYNGGENLKDQTSKLTGMGEENDWEVLLSLQSDFDLGIIFNDYGNFNYLIQKNDLLKNNFSKIETTIWSS